MSIDKVQYIPSRSMDEFVEGPFPKEKFTKVDSTPMLSEMFILKMNSSPVVPLTGVSSVQILEHRYL